MSSKGVGFTVKEPQKTVSLSAGCSVYRSYRGVKM